EIARRDPGEKNHAADKAVPLGAALTRRLVARQGVDDYGTNLHFDAHVHWTSLTITRHPVRGAARQRCAADTGSFSWRGRARGKIPDQHCTIAWCGASG